MIIDLRKSKLFTIEPDIRFSREYNTQKGLWDELWRRHKLLEYTDDELREYFQIKTGKTTNNRGIKRWIIRTEIYEIASPILKMGAHHVNTEIFKKHEIVVLNEFTKHLRFNGNKESRIII